MCAHNERERPSSIIRENGRASKLTMNMCLHCCSEKVLEWRRISCSYDRYKNEARKKIAHASDKRYYFSSLGLGQYCYHTYGPFFAACRPESIYRERILFFYFFFQHTSVVARRREFFRSSDTRASGFLRHTIHRKGFLVSLSLCVGHTYRPPLLSMRCRLLLDMGHI